MVNWLKRLFRRKLKTGSGLFIVPDGITSVRVTGSGVGSGGSGEIKIDAPMPGPALKIECFYEGGEKKKVLPTQWQNNGVPND